MDVHGSVAWPRHTRAVPPRPLDSRRSRGSSSIGGRKLSRAPDSPADPELPTTFASVIEPPALVDAEVELLSMKGVDWSGRDAQGLWLSECELLSATLDEISLQRARLVDVAVLDSSLANITGNDTILSRVRLERVRLTGAVLAAAKLDNVTFVDCRLDMCSLRFSQLQIVSFQRCRMEGTDFYEASLDSVMFTDCDLSGATLANANFVGTEMRGCDLSTVQNAERLRGVRMPWVDVMRIAGELASAIGIEVLDE